MTEENKRFFFLQLPRDFFGSRRIKKLRKMENGDSLVLLYLKIQLSTLETGGIISLSGLEDDPAEEIALEISEEPEAVRRVLNFMLTFGLAETLEGGSIFLPFVEIMTASHTKDAERKRKYRNKKRQEADETETYVGQPRDTCGTSVGKCPDRIKSIEYRVESKEQKGIDQGNPSIPTLPQSDLSISDEIDCCTQIVQRKDVRRLLEAWNMLGLTNIKDINAETKRGGMVRKRIQEHGLDEVLAAIENVKNSKFLMGKTPERFKITFDWFIKPNNFQKVLEGNYEDRPKRTYAETDLPLRAAKTLGRLVNERTGIPKPKDQDLQIWAAELEDCVAENETDFDSLADLMAFSQEDPFWRKNVIDAASLRKHYRKMLAEMNDGGRE